MSATYRPALVWAGQAIMQGKLVFNQSLSTFLSLNRFRKMAIPGAFVESRASPPGPHGRDARRPMVCLLVFSYLLSVKSALLSPATATGLDWFLARSCHAVTL